MRLLITLSSTEDRIGTSTFDGMSVARAVLEYCTDRKKLGAKTLFATHYHELTEAEHELEGVRNFNITAKKRGDDIIFLRKVVPGAADDSYGIEVAKLAGVPDNVIRRAKEILAALENGEPAGHAKPLPSRADSQISLLDLGANEISERLRAVDINTISPIEAMNLLYELKKLL
jgi:DNA mismatch repair protein MutS